MTKKVKLTREQAEAIEYLLNPILRWKVDELIIAKGEGKIFVGKAHSVNEMNVAQLAQALYIGYEVEETFQRGQWIYDITDEDKTVIEVAYVANGRVHGFWKTENNDIGTHVAIENARHFTEEEIAAEKQRRWWAKHGRDVWELRENDLLYYDGEFKEVEEVSEFGAIILSLERAYFPLETIKRKYSIACFAEDRKDVD